jgi:anthraniloyl-CoA monooxygenase
MHGTCAVRPGSILTVSLRAVESSEHRLARRCRCDRAFFGRLGFKTCIESAIALADYLHSEPTMTQAFRRYEDERRLEVLRLQSAARNSTEWFEDVERYLNLDPVQFNYSLLTRSQRISHENLRERDGIWLGDAERWFERQATGRTPQVSRAPMFVPFRVRGIELQNRVVVSPMAQYVRSTARQLTGIWSTMPSAPKEGQGWSLPR